jgi:hypothetical protein
MRKSAEYESRVGSDSSLGMNSISRPAMRAFCPPASWPMRRQGQAVVLQHQAAELSPRVTTGTQDADRKFMHF